MSNVKIDFKIKNNDDEFVYRNIKGFKDKNSLNFEHEGNKFNFDLDNSILKKENNESILILNFKKDKKTDSNYYIKEIDLYIDTKVLTKSLIIDNNSVKIEYELWLNDEYTGKYLYEMKIKEE